MAKLGTEINKIGRIYREMRGACDSRVAQFKGKGYEATAKSIYPGGRLRWCGRNAGKQAVVRLWTTRLREIFLILQVQQLILRFAWRRMTNSRRDAASEVFVESAGDTTSGPASIRLILVNLSAMNADLLRVAFAGQENIHVAGNAANASELAVLLRGKPDVALIASNGSGKGSSALPFLEQIAESAGAVRPIVMSEDMEREDSVSFFYRGARGLVCKARTDFTVLLKCILCVSAGQVWANSEQLEQLLCSLSQPRSLRVTNTFGDALLSQREEQVLHLLARGLSNRDLAKTLKLSEHTVKNHLFRIFDKLGVSNRMEAVLCAMSRNLHRNPPALEAPSTAVETGAA